LRTDLPFLVTRAHDVQHALQPPITGLAVGAGLAALGLVAVAGSFWAERRRTELELLSVRGVGPAALAGKGAIECALPLFCGLAVGTALAVLGVVLLGPARSVTPNSVVVATLFGPAGWLAALVAVAVAVRRRLRTGPVRRTRRSALPGTALEVLLLVAALAGLRQVSPLQTSSQTESLPTFGLARLVLPLLVLVLLARVVARIGVFTLGRLRGRGDSWRVPLLLAVQRLGAVPRVPAALAVAVAVASGTCLYAAGLASSLQRTVAAKAEVFVGGQGAIELNGRQPLPRIGGLEHTTPVLYLSRPRLDSSSGPTVDVVAVEPSTLAHGAAWDPSYSGASLATLMHRIAARTTADAVPAIAVGDVPDQATMVLDLNAPLPVPVRVVARVRAFPGMRTPPFLVVARPVLEKLAPTAAESSTERLWVDGPIQPLAGRLRSAGLQIRSTLTVESVSAAPSLEAVLDTLNVLRSLGLLAAVLAAVGLLVYVDVRARQRRLASVLTRRMGLRARADWLSGWLEIGGAAGAGLVVGTFAGMGLVAYVSSLLDPIPLVPPQPIVVLPLRYAGGLAIATLAVTALAAAMTLRSTRTDAAVLRAE
jgi:putative ABC transport system permease protein